ncbi:MAG: beta-hydroxyacyl-ACP dehydratase [Phycisphaerales bacterium]|nr:beta-hydroxyacyl-ACP dehydratase [Phycisphaerales bacterium]
MRWIWIDAFTEFVPKERATAVKNVTLAEEYLHDHFPGYPVLPPSLMIEGMAQTAGILVGEAADFREKVILAKIRVASFDDYPVPGDQVAYQAEIEHIDEAAASINGTILRNGHKIGTVSLMFSHADQATVDLGLPEHNFVFNDQFMDLLNTYRIKAAAKPA